MPTGNSGASEGTRALARGCIVWRSISASTSCGADSRKWHESPIRWTMRGRTSRRRSARWCPRAVSRLDLDRAIARLPPGCRGRVHPSRCGRVRAQRGGKAPRCLGRYVEVAGAQGTHEAAGDVERNRAMSCQDYEIALGDYVDGTLDERSRIELEAHLASCERCRAVVADFSVVRQVTLALEPELPPATRVDEARRPRSRPSTRSTFHGWGFTWQIARGIVRHDHADREPCRGSAKGWRPINGSIGTPRVGDAGQVEPTSVKAQFDLAEVQYTNAIAGLESITKSEQSALDMETADVLQANLTVIDGAITESRAALQTEPDNPDRAGEPVRCAAQQTRTAAGRRGTHQRNAERQS